MWRAGAVTLLAIVTPAWLVAQTPAGLPPGEQPEQPTFRADITLITNDVIVRDGNGQFISDLTTDDFEIYEDGVKQEISSLVLIHGGRAFNLQLPPAPVQEGLILPTARAQSDTAGRIFMLFVDDLHMEPETTPRIRHLFKQIMENLIHEGDLFSIVSSGPSSLAINLTYDRKLLEAAIGRIMGFGLTPTDIITGAQTSQGPAELMYRANVAFRTALNVVGILKDVEHRRKAIIYVSTGYDLNPFEASRFAAAASFGGRFNNVATQRLVNPLMQQSNYAFLNMDLNNQLHRLTVAANRANVSFYTIDPRGLVAGTDLGEMDGQLDPAEWFDFVRKSQDSLRTLAEETGGIAIVNNNNFTGALKRIDAETSDYYVLGYYSSNSDPTAWRRQLEVRVAREDVEIWSRTVYELDRPVESESTPR